MPTTTECTGFDALWAAITVSSAAASVNASPSKHDAHAACTTTKLPSIQHLLRNATVRLESGQGEHYQHISEKDCAVIER